MADSVPGCLKQLNAGVPHRYSGVFRLYKDVLQNTHMYDKKGELRPEALEVVLLKDSFCQIVLRDGFLLSDHAGHDERLNYSPFQAMVVAYHGVPIVTTDGDIYGTLCHFDMVEQQLSDDEFFCMQETAALLAGVLAGR